MIKKGEKLPFKEDTKPWTDNMQIYNDKTYIKRALLFSKKMILNCRPTLGGNGHFRSEIEIFTSQLTGKLAECINAFETNRYDKIDWNVYPRGKSDAGDLDNDSIKASKEKAKYLLILKKEIKIGSDGDLKQICNTDKNITIEKPLNKIFSYRINLPKGNIVFIAENLLKNGVYYQNMGYVTKKDILEKIKNSDYAEKGAIIGNIYLENDNYFFHISDLK